MDWKLIGNNIRHVRTASGFTQKDLAQRAGVTLSTIYHAECGRPLMRQTLEKICQGCDTSLEGLLNIQRDRLSEDVRLLVDPCLKTPWNVLVELRSKVPKDDTERIQSPEERMRLGRLGFVACFVRSTTFIMPEGPGLLQLELYGSMDGSLNESLYRDCLLSCTSGTVRLEVAGQSGTLTAGGIAGFRSADLQRLDPVGDEMPVRLTWIGAVRIGKVAQAAGAKTRVRPRRTG